MFMHKNNFYVFFGVWVAILPFTGIPGVWKNGLIFASGIFIVLTVVGPAILRDLTKTKPIRRKQKVSNENSDSALKINEAGAEQKVELAQESTGNEDHNNNL